MIYNNQNNFTFNHAISYLYGSIMTEGIKKGIKDEKLEEYVLQKINRIREKGVKKCKSKVC